MIVGTGLIAKAMSPDFSKSPDILIYASGVSNSSCIDRTEFDREERCLNEAMRNWMLADAFIYFSSCSVQDPTTRDNAYPQHKLKMERIVSQHPRHIIARLPQVAGKTPNPHTLLNYLYARIVRGERFTLWKNATRNIIDIEDVSTILGQLIYDPRCRATTINIANPNNYPMANIVDTFEIVLDKKAHYQEMEIGGDHKIDISPIYPIVDRMNIDFEGNYLREVIDKYYGRTE